jgi:hypothetical protein
MPDKNKMELKSLKNTTKTSVFDVIFCCGCVVLKTFYTRLHKTPHLFHHCGHNTQKIVAIFTLIATTPPVIASLRQRAWQSIFPCFFVLFKIQ